MYDNFEMLDNEGFLDLLKYNIGDESDVEGIEMNDEIVSIEPYGKVDTIDIEVTGNHLFYANDILTHNSAYGNTEVGMEAVADSLGIVQTADVFMAIITTEQLKEQSLVLAKFLKNRNTGQLDTLTLSVDYPKMRFSDFDDEGYSSSQPTSDSDDYNMDDIVSGQMFNF